MNPSIQQMILSTPICNPLYLTKLSKTSSLLINNPTTKNRLGLIIDHLVEKLNPAQLKSVRCSLASNLTLIQTPSGTNKVLTTVEIVRAWLKYSPFQILIYSQNRMNCDMVHMGLLKSGMRSLCLAEELPLEEDYKNGYDSILNLACNNNFYLNPLYTKSEDMKSLLNEFRVICCSKDEILSESLKHVSFSRILVDDANQLCETAMLLPLIKNCQQLVMIGDDKHLCPITTSLMAQSKGLNLSLFDRLIKQGIQTVTLNIQYCMSPSLSIFPS